MDPIEYAALPPKQREAVYLAATGQERVALGFPRLAPLAPHTPWDGMPLSLWVIDISTRLAMPAQLPHMQTTLIKSAS